MPKFNIVEPIVMFLTVVQWLFLAVFAGALVGTGTSFFLLALQYFSQSGSSMPLWLQMIILPVGGLLNGLLLYYGYRANKTELKDSVISAVHHQSGKMPLKTLLIKPIAAIITLSCGGSAGKEGPCSHIGGGLASGFAQVLHLNAELRKRLVACGVSAGFASVFGTPVAGAIYGIEMLAIGRIQPSFLFPALVAGVTSFEVSKYWGISYDYYVIDLADKFSQTVFIKIIFIGIFCGVVAWFFVNLVKFSRDSFQCLQERCNLWPPIMPCIGGGLLALLILFVPTDYLGLSLPLIDRSLTGEAMPFFGFFWKTLLVAITLGSGFYGGIVTPQFVIGAIAGSAFAPLIGISPAMGAATGLVAVVAAASNTPIAAILMGVELFGAPVGTLYVSGACIAAYLIIGHRSVYPDQQMVYSKSSWMQLSRRSTTSPEKFYLSAGLLKALARHPVGRKLLRHTRR